MHSCRTRTWDLSLDMCPLEDMSMPMTGLLSPSFDRAVLKREIFGPIIPILAVASVEEAQKVGKNMV